MSRTVVASPVLVGRDELLSLADRRLADAAAGRGRLLFVSGEAGIGKTRLLSSISRRAERAGFTVARAAAFPGDTDSSGGVLLDLASDLRRAAEPDLAELGRRIAARLRETAADDDDPQRRRRLMVADLTDLVSDLDVGRRLLVVLEDLHWADQLSLDVVGHVAARLGFRAMLVLGAYRTDELYPRTPMRLWRGQLLSQRVAEEIRLPRLTAAQTAVLASSVLGRSAPTQVLAAIHARSDGIPLHVEELLAAAGEAADRPGGDTGIEVLGVPDTLADAVLARCAVLDADTREVVAAAAVIGRSFDFDLLTAVTDRDAETVDRSLRALRHAYLVQEGADPVTVDFRHALIRDAVYADLPLPRRRTLHERVAHTGVERGLPDAFVSAHFDLAGLGGPAYAHALAAAREAAALSSHAEALRLYRRALRNQPADLTAHEQAALQRALGGEALAVDENAAALEGFLAAHELWTGAGDRVAAAAVVPRIAAVEHLLGETLEARAARLQTALSSLDGVAGRDADAVRANLLSALSAAYMLDRRLDESIAFGEAGRDLGEQAGDEHVMLDSAATLGSVLVFAGRADEGWPMIEESVARAVALDHEEEAARAYRMISTSASVLVEYDRAEHWLDRGIAYADGVERWNHRNYMAAHRAHVLWATGRWARAEQVAQHTLADGRSGITTLITAEYVLGYLALGRGDWDAAEAHLEVALREGESMTELQRLSPPTWGYAEAALLRGDLDGALRWCERGEAASRKVADAAYLFPFLVTGVRAHLARAERTAAADWLERVGSALTGRAIPGTLPALDHARGLLQLAGGEAPAAVESLRTARLAWAARRRFWEGSWAALDEARALVAVRRPADASALADQVRAAADAAGAATLVAAADEAVRSGRRARPTEPWHPLTDREYDVATLVAEGLTNREIAARLVLSPKTVSAHVEHILTKLGAGRRAEIAAWAARVQA